jgi:5-methylcytosine-specific restriction endonuclease McrA
VKKESLHQMVDAYFSRHKRRMLRALVHALVDLGQVTSLACQWDKCVLPGVPMEPSGRGPACISLDHIIALENGGSDRPENLQLLHNTCNNRKASIFSDSRRAIMSGYAQRRWRDPKYRDHKTCCI